MHNWSWINYYFLLHCSNQTIDRMNDFVSVDWVFDHLHYVWRDISASHPLKFGDGSILEVLVCIFHLYSTRTKMFEPIDLFIKKTDLNIIMECLLKEFLVFIFDLYHINFTTGYDHTIDIVNIDRYILNKTNRFIRWEWDITWRLFLSSLAKYCDGFRSIWTANKFNSEEKQWIVLSTTNAEKCIEEISIGMWLNSIFDINAIALSISEKDRFQLWITSKIFK